MMMFQALRAVSAATAALRQLVAVDRQQCGHFEQVQRRRSSLASGSLVAVCLRPGKDLRA
jgi:hypothetical protein